MTDNQIEQEIQAKGLTAPRVTPADVEANIASEHYFRAGEAVRSDESGCDVYHSAPFGHSMGSLRTLEQITFCVLTTKNGTKLVGANIGPVSPPNFDAELGRKLARQNAIDQLWPMMGYQLRTKLQEQATQMERIARICHEVNRAYCQALGDMSQPYWHDAPEWQRESARMGVDLHTMGDFGPEASHISWMRQKHEDGWKYGPVKDADKKEHPCMLPFEALPCEQQAKDFIFRAIVHAMTRG